MLSFSTSISKELNYIGLLGSEKSATDGVSSDILSGLSEVLLSENCIEDTENSILSGNGKKKLFKDVFSDIAKNIATKQRNENITITNVTLDGAQQEGVSQIACNDITLQELLNVDFAIENAESKLEESAISDGQGIEISSNDFSGLQNKVTINNEIKHFAQKFADNKTIVEKSNTLEQNILADWGIVSELNLQAKSTDITTNGLNSKENTSNKNVNAQIKLDNDTSVNINGVANNNPSSVANNTTNNSSRDSHLQVAIIDEIEMPVNVEIEETSVIIKNEFNSAVNDIEMEDNVDTTVQLPDLSIEYSNTLATDKNIVNIVPVNTEMVNNKIIEPIDNTDISTYNTVSFVNSEETYSTKNFNNKYITNNHNYSHNKQIGNSFSTGSTLSNNEMSALSDSPSTTKVPAQHVMSISTNKDKSKTDIDKAELNINNISSHHDINDINDTTTNNAPKQNNVSNIETTINSNKIDNIKIVLSKLLNLTTNSATFGDQNIMLTTHKNHPDQFSANMDEVLNIQSIEVSSDTTGTKQVSDWVKTMPASKVNYIASNESYNFLENVVNNIVDKFYANDAKYNNNSFEINSLLYDTSTALKPLSLKFDSQTAAEYQLAASPIINEIFAKIEGSASNISNKSPISLLNNDLAKNSMQAAGKPIKLPATANQSALNTSYNNDMLFNVKEIPLVSENSNLDIFVQEDNWEVLFDISDAENHIIFQSDFKNTDVLNNNRFSEVKLNIMSTNEQPVDVVPPTTKFYTVKNYTSDTEATNNAIEYSNVKGDIYANNEIIYDNISFDADTELKTVVNDTNTEKLQIKTTNAVKSLSDTDEYMYDENISVPKQYHLVDKEVTTHNAVNYKNDYSSTKSSEIKSDYVYTNEDISFEEDIEDATEVNDTTTKKTHIKTTDKIENSFDVTKSANDSKNVVMQDNKTTYESVRNVMPNETAPVKLENNNASNIPLNTFNLSGLASNSAESKQVAKNTKKIDNSITNKIVTDDTVVMPKVSLQNISLKSINNRDVSTDNNYQVLHNQSVSDNRNIQPEQNAIQLDETAAQPIVNKENTIDTNTIQQEPNAMNVKTENNAQPAVSRTFINIKPDEMHRVVWHTADNMLKEGSKTAAKSIKIVMNPQSLGDVIVEIKLQNNAANVSFKAKNIEALNEIEKNIGALKDMLINTDIKATEFKYEKINTTNDSSRNFGEFNQQQNNQQQSKNNQQQSRREFLNSVLNDNDSIKHDVTLQNSFYKLVEEYV